MIQRLATVLRLRDLGYENFHHSLSACIDLNSPPTRLPHCTVALITAGAAASDALSFTASIQALGASALTLEYGESSALPMQAAWCRAHADAVIACGMTQSALEYFAEHCAALALPLCNGGSTLGHPCAALGDLAYGLSQAAPQDTLRIAWVGGVNGLAHSLIEAAMYASFELFMAVPEWAEPDIDLLGLALKAGGRIFLTRDPALALDGAHYVYAGLPCPADHALSAAHMRLTPDMLHYAREGAVVLAGTASMPHENLWDAPSHVRRLQYRSMAQNIILSQWLENIPRDRATSPRARP